jgi:hypothetical protein
MRYGDVSDCLLLLFVTQVYLANDWASVFLLLQGKQGCSFVADSRCPDECCSNNVEPPDDRMSEYEHARRVHQLEKENATLQQKINWLQHELRQSDACLAFKKDEYNTLIGAVRVTIFSFGLMFLYL